MGKFRLNHYVSWYRPKRLMELSLYHIPKNFGITCCGKMIPKNSFFEQLKFTPSPICQKCVEYKNG